MTIPRSEYPRPQFERDNWLNLNGEWQFGFDFGSSDPENYEETGKKLPKTITVPFCPESRLSGVEFKDFMNTVWYKKTVTLDEKDLSGRVILHFGAVDYTARVWVNGERVAKHSGGYVPFEVDITGSLHNGENEITVRADDDSRSGNQPRGKQCDRFRSAGCDYTRTTGIWQTVWLEFVPKTYLGSVRVKTDYRTGCVAFCAKVTGETDCSSKLITKVSYKGKTVAEKEVAASSYNTYSITVDDPKLWDVGKPELYDVEYTLVTAGGTDTVRSYFGIRGVELGHDCLKINGRRVFMRLVLDQGFYADGICTAPSDDDLVNDIKLSMEFGFNGARLHQKVFEERFLYHADRLGYIVWGEYGSWGIDHTDPAKTAIFIPEWLEAVQRDINHPSIIGWCPLNETWNFRGRQTCPDFARNIYRVTKAVDDTRPCIDSSGAFHFETDIFDLHDYDQDPESIRRNYADTVVGERVHDIFSDRQEYNGAPIFISECGGIFWEGHNGVKGWGYGESPKDESEYVNRFCGIVSAFMDNENICGICYTQLTDIEQEQNGVYTYSREKKFSEESYRRMREALTAVAAIEKKDDV